MGPQEEDFYTPVKVLPVVPEVILVFLVLVQYSLTQQRKKNNS